MTSWAVVLPLFVRKIRNLISRYIVIGLDRDVIGDSLVMYLYCFDDVFIGRV